jgi:hypothetical protein
MELTQRLNKRPRVEYMATPIDKAIALGCNAPNPHNSQAWKLRNASDLQTVLYADEARAAGDRPADAANPRRLRLLHRNLVGRSDVNGLRDHRRVLPGGNVRPG